jgi:hypothetical protein
MCVTQEDETNSAGVEIDSTGSVEQMLVTAQRIGINLDVYQTLDWSKVLPFAILGGIGGAWNGLPGIAVGSLLGAAGSIETQTGMTSLFYLVNDLPVEPGLPGPYLPIY